MKRDHKSSLCDRLGLNGLVVQTTGESKLFLSTYCVLVTATSPLSGGTLFLLPVGILTGPIESRGDRGTEWGNSSLTVPQPAAEKA